MINMCLSILSVMLLAFGLWKLFDIKSGTAPLISICTIMCIVIVCAMMNWLIAGVYISYAIAVSVFAIAIINRNGKNWRDFFTAPLILFLGFVIFMFLTLNRQNPVLSQWDEFSFWGTAAKLVKERGALYTYYKSSMIGSSMPPALPLLCYYFGYGFTEFCEWARFFAYDFLFLACFSTVVSIFDNKNSYLSFPTFVTLFLLPFFFGQTEYTIGLSPVYITLYSEIPLVCLFVGAVAVYRACPQDNEKSVLPVLPIIAVLTFAKDMGLALSCIALFIIFWDMVCSRREFKLFGVNGLWAKVISAFLMLVVTGLSYFGWAFHMSCVMQRDPTALGGESNMGAVGLVVSGIKELFGVAPRSEKFTTITKLMINAFFNTRISMVGSGFVVCCVIFVVFFLAFVAGDRQLRTESAVMYLSSLVGFVGYYIFHLFLYVYIFKDNAYELTSYNRYIYPYYMGWMIFGIICLSLSVNNGRWKIGAGAIISFSIVIALCCARYLKSQNTFMDINHNVYTKRITIKQQADFLKDTIDKNDVIFLLSEEDSGQSWFIYTYELTDNLIYQEPYIITDSSLSEEAEKKEYQQKLAQFMKEKNITHFMVDFPSDRMCENIGELFDTNIGQFGIGSVGYFKINYTEDSFYCQLVKGTAIN